MTPEERQHAAGYIKACHCPENDYGIDKVFNFLVKTLDHIDEQDREIATLKLRLADANDYIDRCLACLKL